MLVVVPVGRFVDERSRALMAAQRVLQAIPERAARAIAQSSGVMPESFGFAGPLFGFVSLPSLFEGASLFLAGWPQIGQRVQPGEGATHQLCHPSGCISETSGLVQRLGVILLRVHRRHPLPQFYHADGAV